MTTLRDEIQKGFPWLCPEEVRDIVKIFEKRIDEMESHSSKRGWIHIDQIKMEMFE